MKRQNCIMLYSTLMLLLLTVVSLAAYASARDEYAVGGELIPVNPAPFLLSPTLLAAVTAVLLFIIASIFVKGFPIKIVIERA